MKLILQKSFNKQRGLSIVELMVALVLSLVVLLVTTGIYVSNKQTYRFLDLQAGYPRQAGLNAFPTLPLNDTGTNNSDNIIVRFRSNTDCVNDTAPNIGGFPTATNTLRVAPDAVTGAPQLQCNGFALVDGVETMQVAYGVDTDSDGIANTYATSAQVQGVISGSSWAEVVSVRVAILVQGEANVLDQAQAITYNLLGNPYLAANDRTPRRVFTTTIPLRNKNRSVI